MSTCASKLTVKKESQDCGDGKICGILADMTLLSEAPSEGMSLLARTLIKSTKTIISYNHNVAGIYGASVFQSDCMEAYAFSDSKSSMLAGVVELTEREILPDGSDAFSL